MKSKSVALPMSTIAMFIIPMLVCLFNAALIARPQEVFAAAKEGVSLWFNNVLPSLLPFMVGINILNGTGFSIFLGELLSPVMSAVFGLPGAGGFALLTGLTSGYPMGAKVTAELCTQGRLTRNEAQRLLGFCNNAGPLFIIGVAGIGLFNSAAAGYCLWIAHVTAAITLGIVSRLSSRISPWTSSKVSPGLSLPLSLPLSARAPLTQSPAHCKSSKNNNRHLLHRAYHAFTAYRRAHDCAFGPVLSGSVQNAMSAVTVIGGYIIFFCVLSRMLTLMLNHAGILGGASIIGNVSIFKNTALLLEGSVVGILEMTNGVKLLAASVLNHSVVPQGTTADSAAAYMIVSRNALACAAAIISFGGFSIHAQTLYFLRGAGIRALPYIESKALHALFAFIYCRFFYGFFDMHTINTVPAMKLLMGVVPYSWREAIGLCAVVGFALPALLWAAARLFIRRCT